MRTHHERSAVEKTSSDIRKAGAFSHADAEYGLRQRCCEESGDGFGDRDQSFIGRRIVALLHHGRGLDSAKPVDNGGEERVFVCEMLIEDRLCNTGHGDDVVDA